MESYFSGWVSRLQELVSDLLSAPRDNSDVCSSLVSRVLAHCHDYYNRKSILTSTNVLAVLSPSWLTPYERAFLWVGGWKPSLAFRLARVRSDHPLSASQERAVEELEKATANEEKELLNEMTKVQEMMAMPTGREASAEAVVAALEELVASADALRVQTVVKMVEILSPAQNLDFLTVAAQLHLRVRAWGEGRAAA